MVLLPARLTLRSPGWAAFDDWLSVQVDEDHILKEDHQQPQCGGDRGDEK
jgi:hypothetical protein